MQGGGLRGEVSHLHNVKEQPLAMRILTEIQSMVMFAESVEQQGLYPLTSLLLDASAGGSRALPASLKKKKTNKKLQTILTRKKNTNIPTKTKNSTTRTHIL